MKVKPTVNPTTATGSHTSQKQGGAKQKRMPVQFILLIASALLLAACSSGLQDELPEVDAAASTKSTQSRITSDQNDAEEKVSGRVIVNSRDLELGYEGKGRQTVALRFEDVNVPRGASIKKAEIQFQTDKTDTASLKVRIRAEDTNDAKEFSTSKHNLSKRSKTSASVSWKLDSWKKRGERSSKQRTPNLDDVVQEVTKRKGWDSGNSMVFFIADSKSDNKRIAKSYKDNPKSAPVLYIEYTGGKSGGSDNAKKPKKPTDSGPKVGKADYYVSPKNGNDSNSGSKSKPFKTLQRVSEVIKPGDVVFLRGGTYTGRKQSYMQWTDNAFTTNGKKGAPITIMSYPGERAVIDGSDRKYTEYKSLSSPQLVSIKGDYYEIRNITIRNGAGRGLVIKGDHNIVSGVISHGHHSDGKYVMGDDNVIENSKSYDNYSYQNGGDSADCIKMVASNNNVIRDNEFRDCSDDGIDIWDSRNTLVENNVSNNNGRGSSGNGRGIKGGTRSAKNTGNIIRGNKASGNIVNIDLNHSTGLEVYDNESSNARQAGFVIFKGSKVYDNTSKNDRNNSGDFR